VRPEGLSTIPSGIKPATFPVVGQRLNRLRCRVSTFYKSIPNFMLLQTKNKYEALKLASCDFLAHASCKSISKINNKRAKRFNSTNNALLDCYVTQECLCVDNYFFGLFRSVIFLSIFPYSRLSNNALARTVFYFLHTFSETHINQSRRQNDIITYLHRASCRGTYFGPILTNLRFIGIFLLIIPNADIMSFHPAGAELFHADYRRKDRQTYDEANSHFCYFVKAPINCFC
jgi:hypothetical protein